MDDWAELLLREREATLRAIRDPQRSPYAAVARADFAGETPLVLGSDAACDVPLETALPQHARVRVDGGLFAIDALDPGATVEVLAAGQGGTAAQGPVRAALVGPGARVLLGRYTLRLSHQNFPGVIVLDPQSARLREGPAPRWFPPDPAFRVEAQLEREADAHEQVVISTRGNQRRALRLGRLRFQLGAQELHLGALRLLEPGVDEASVSILFRDRTTGQGSYPVGRYIDLAPLPAGADRFLLDFNRAYNPSCAFSPLYNCPIPPRENLLAVAVAAGEQDPGGHQS